MNQKERMLLTGIVAAVSPLLFVVILKHKRVPNIIQVFLKNRLTIIILKFYSNATFLFTVISDIIYYLVKYLHSLMIH